MKINLEAIHKSFYVYFAFAYNSIKYFGQGIQKLAK